MSKRATFHHRRNQATSAPPKPKDTYFWTPGVHITVGMPLDLQVVQDILSLHPWTVCSAVEEHTPRDGRHTHIMIWAPQIPLGPTEIKWSAKDLSVRLGKWPHIQPIVTQNNAITVTAYQCKQSMPALYTVNEHVHRMWTQAVYDKSCELHQRAVLDAPHLIESYNAQVKRIADTWHLYPEQ